MHELHITWTSAIRTRHQFLRLTWFFVRFFVSQTKIAVRRPITFSFFFHFQKWTRRWILRIWSLCKFQVVSMRLRKTIFTSREQLIILFYSPLEIQYQLTLKLLLFTNSTHFRSIIFPIRLRRRLILHCNIKRTLTSSWRTCSRGRIVHRCPTRNLRQNNLWLWVRGSWWFFWWLCNRRCIGWTCGKRNWTYTN